ncbi:hypothetical protein Hanom_Chr10g00875901 [Helianthus anomalus]
MEVAIGSCNNGSCKKTPVNETMTEKCFTTVDDLKFGQMVSEKSRLSTRLARK